MIQTFPVGLNEQDSDIFRGSYFVPFGLKCTEDGYCRELNMTWALQGAEVRLLKIRCSKYVNKYIKCLEGI